MVKVKRSIIKQGNTAKAIIIPGMFLSGLVDEGFKEPKEVWIEFIEDHKFVVTPILEKKK
jgi:hypothetical protein